MKRFSLVDISSVPQPANNSDEVKELKQTVCALKERLVEMEAKATQCTSPPFPSSSARMSMPFGSFPLNPWAFSMSTMMPFTPQNMISQIEMPRSSFAELYDDDIKFEGVFSNYGSASPIKIRREVVEDCWRKACSRSNFAVLLARKAFSERESATSNCTGDHRYKKALSPNRLKAVKEAISSVQPQQPGQKPEDWWKPYKDAINTSCRGLCCRQLIKT